MVLPVVAYGHPVLKHVAEDIEENSPEIQQLIADMFETMYILRVSVWRLRRSTSR